ncbi:glycosyltransferase [Luteimonas viscosa]|uniref:Glycosyltransferase n=1 Tax=Luteimonas viscosa TaxID=1132694 RepID=A0A5D4XRN2_9GAMM|nr:glycosyltransferase [Luteimonas viscosa]TYT26603.1 glycosyltransferase [Luteimonas viscosa]
MRPHVGNIPLGHAPVPSPRRERIELSIIVPFHDQASALPHCLERLRRVGEQLAVPCEFLFVDGGSSDGGAEFLARQAASCPQIRLVRPGRKPGKDGAMTAGLGLALGDALVVLDADLRDPPELIPRMVSAWREGADVVLMQRRVRAGEPVGKPVVADPAGHAIDQTGNVDDPLHAGDFRLMARKALDALQLLPQRNDRTKELFARVGIETRVIEYDHAPGAGCGSRSGTLRLLRQAIGSIASSPTPPFRWGTPVGVALVAGLGLWLLLLGESVLGQPSPASAISFFGGVKLLDEQLFVFLNSLGSEPWDGLWLFITHKLTWIPFYAGLVYLLYRNFGLKNTLVIIALITVMAAATDQLSNLFKHGFERPRPCREEHLSEVIRYIAPRCGRYGYFSAHAASSMALAVFLGLLFRKTHRYLAPVLLVWSSMVGFSRIYVGVHYPLDVLTGMVVGALVGWLIYRLAQRLELSRAPQSFGHACRPSNGHGSLPKPGRRQT